MDPLTHGLLGASLGQALSGPAGRRALVWGALIGMAPDLWRFVRLLPAPVSTLLPTLWRGTLVWS